MTTTKSVQAIVELNAKAEAIGKGLVAPMLAKGFNNLDAADLDLLIKYLVVGLDIQERLQVWLEAEGGYEGWMEMFTYVNGPESDFSKIDDSGEIRKLCDEMFITGDLEGYYHEVVMPSLPKLEEMRIATSMLRDMINGLKEMRSAL